MGEPVEFLSQERAHEMAHLAERARSELSRLSGQPVDYDAAAVQLLDEWIEGVPSPPHGLQVLWIAFLGEIFRRRYAGEWVMRRGDGERLAVLCPRESGGVRRVEVTAQMGRRLAHGVADSLALFYACESVLLRQPQAL